MSGDNKIVLYDIASGPPRTCYAPNPWKTRYALNFKGVDYRTEWVELPDVARTRKELGVPACRFHPNGEPFYTLPVIHDPATGEFVGKTIDIAVYLDKNYPDKPTLIPPRSLALMRAFDEEMDALFTPLLQIGVENMPFNPATAEQTKADFVKRGTLESWDQLILKGEARTKFMEDTKVKLGKLAQLFVRPEGPFLEGEEPTYADLLIGAWLKAMSITAPEAEWAELMACHGGVWGKFHSALQKYAEVK